MRPKDIDPFDEAKITRNLLGDVADSELDEMQKALEEFEEGPKPDDTEKLLKQLREATDPREILKRRLAKVT